MPNFSEEGPPTFINDLAAHVLLGTPRLKMPVIPRCSLSDSGLLAVIVGHTNQVPLQAQPFQILLRQSFVLRGQTAENQCSGLTPSA